MNLNELISEAHRIIEELADPHVIDTVVELAKLRIEKIIRQAESVGYNEAYETVKKLFERNYPQS